MVDIKVNSITSDFWVRKAFDSTVKFKTNLSKSDIYRMEHSPIRVQEFFIEMIGIPTFVSIHFVRHKIGVEHFVQTNRDDRGGEEADRWTPIKHSMKINAEALINMARKRLCLTSHKETVKIMSLIKQKIYKADWALAQFMVPDCVYRGGICKEGGCRQKQQINKKYSYYKDLF